MRKTVGIMPLYDDEKESYWMLPGYMKMLEAENAIPMMLPLTSNVAELDDFLEICGGFLLTGGHDVSPNFYHCEKKTWCGECCELRDQMEHYILTKAVEQNKSVLGICRGIQFMNACYEGTLYQDLETEYASNIDHHMKPPYDRAAHQVLIQKDTPLFDITHKEEIGVNSYHHQAIHRLSPEFQVTAVSEDGLIEGIYMPTHKFVLGVQWHPEFSYEKDDNSKSLIRAFATSI